MEAYDGVKMERKNKKSLFNWQVRSVLCTFIWSMITWSKDFRVTLRVKSSFGLSYIVHIRSPQPAVKKGLARHNFVPQHQESLHIQETLSKKMMRVVVHDVHGESGRKIRHCRRWWTRNSLDGRKNAMRNAWLQWQRGCIGVMGPYAAAMAVWLCDCHAAWLHGCGVATVQRCNGATAPLVAAIALRLHRCDGCVAAPRQ